MNDLLENKSKRPMWLTVVALVAILFGIATVKEGGTVLFTETGKQSAGNYVPFVLWFNFIAGFAYIMSGIAMFKLKSCSRRLSAVIAISTTIVFILLGIHIFNDGLYELRTVMAMTIRSTLWISIAIVALRAKALKPVSCHC
ncbi:MAG: hypothetical protein KBD76_08140 [Bacteriovorax sp.]|jgi:hypothetical protein|nr:hypothetical protein [Bacteriovorax sp.]